MAIVLYQHKGTLLHGLYKSDFNVLKCKSVAIVCLSVCLKKDLLIKKTISTVIVVEFG